MHRPVLLNEVIKYLNPKPGENFIDCTIGEASHSLAILERIKPGGKILGIDADPHSLERIKPREEMMLIQGNFRDLEKIVKEQDFRSINGILFDLGLSSWQIEESGRGFSFKKDEPLLMNYEPGIKNYGLTVEIIINRWPEKELIRIFQEYGEERYSRKIAKRIIEERRMKQIAKTSQLLEIIKKSVPYSKTKRGQIDRVAARIFQSLRIVVNDELENLNQGLEQALKILEPEGRLVVISFHSLEDRIVKNFLREQQNRGSLKILTKKPIVASDEEVKMNSRSRSAKLRAAIKTGDSKNG